MNRSFIPLGRLFGIPIGLDFSWFLIFILLTSTLAVNYFPARIEAGPALIPWFLGALTVILLFASVMFHELGHSLVALRYKIPVQRITLFIFGGLAEIAAEPKSALAEFWIAIAGPVASLILAAFFGLVSFVLHGKTVLGTIAIYLAITNGSLALFNLLPGFPLDGGRVFRAAVWGLSHDIRRATLIAARVGQAVAFLFIIAGVWQILESNFLNGLWIIFIGWFLDNAAASQVQQWTVRDLLAGHTVAQAMNRNFTTIPADTSLQELVDYYILGSGQRFFLVVENSDIVGLLTIHLIKQVPRTDWITMPVRQAMLPLNQVRVVSPETGLWTALEEMDRDGVNQLPVMKDGRVVGLLTRDSVISFLRTLRELGAV